jgi:hypothetical protein
MTSLRELQQTFARALLGESDAPVDALIVSHGIPAAERAGIYRNNVRATFRNTMQLGFPAVARLVGAEYFRQLVDEYRQQHPSRSGNLQHVGAAFAAHLAGRFHGSPFEYLTDVAAIEWAYQEILAAPEYPPLDLTALAAVPEADYAALRLRLHPAARVLASRFPLVRIWRANRDETLDSTPIDLGSGGDRVLLMRRGLDVEIHRLAAAEYSFLDASARGASLVEALDAAATADPQAEPAPLLGRFASLGAIVGFAGARPPRLLHDSEPDIGPTGAQPCREPAASVASCQHLATS